MKSIIATILICFVTNCALSIDGAPFEVIGKAKLIATWNVEDDVNRVNGTLSGGDEISISILQGNLTVQVIHNKVGNQLLILEDYDTESLMISVYEYDFDKDGLPEIMVVDSPEFSIVNIHIYRYSNGLSELVGNLFGQFGIFLEDNLITLPYGSQGLVDEYLYKDGSFFNLVFHDPNKED